MADLKLLTKKRGTIKAKQTLFETYLDTFQTDLEAQKITANNFVELESRYKRFEPLLESFNEVQSEIELLVEEENIAAQIQERESFENIFYKLITVSEVLLKAHFTNNQNSEGISANSINVNSVSLNSIKLPQISLPKFSGIYDNWLEFKDTFESLIHTNNTISEIQKFHYLRASLEGSAAEVVHSLDFSADNYTVAWDLICERFNNKRLLVHGHVKALFNLPNILSESSKDLRKMLDTVSKHLRSLKNLEQPTEKWDTLIIYIMASKLDKLTAREWEEFKVEKELPSLEHLKQFIKNKADLLETLERNAKHGNVATKSNQKSFIATYNKCPCCNIESHPIYRCTKFQNLPVNSRLEQVKMLNLCQNCLRGKHHSKDCEAGHCRKCTLKHNTLLHFDKNSRTSQDQSNNKPNTSQSKIQTNIQGETQLHTHNDSESSIQGTSQSLKHNESKSNIQGTSKTYMVQSDDVQGFSDNISFSSHVSNTDVLLSTALVNVRDNKGQMHTCRALLDSGSQSCFISQNLVNKLNLTTSQVNLSVVGIGNVCSNLNSRCSLVFRSLQQNYEQSISCLIIPSIGENIPSKVIKVGYLRIPNHVSLADPLFNEPSNVDLLLGAGVFWNLLSAGQIQLGPKQPVLQNTKLGWVVAGQVSWASTKPKLQCYLSTERDIQNQLTKFWELEESKEVQALSRDEMTCEQIFSDTVTRDSSGKFMVTIPLKGSTSKLGNSKQVAIQRFYSIENKLRKNPLLCDMYTKFINEYQQLGHMSRVGGSDDAQITYYLPHHGVLREQSTTSKLRVVFDGSCATDTGLSFNDIQYVGPKIQRDLVSILLNFREHNVVMSADIEKMYRQIFVQPHQRSLQRIIWRNNPADELEVYELNTVTYGTASAPFLAVRCLKQLAIENLEKNPRASKVLLRDFYVDDMLTGARDLGEAKLICEEVSSVLSSSGMNLRKWNSNDKNLLREISGSNSQHIVKFGENEGTKTLGLNWDSISDVLMYNIGGFKILNNTTKRCILSDIAQIYDPLGLIGPVIIQAKIMLQKLWALKLAWDDTIPQDLERQWIKFRDQIKSLNTLQIPRQVTAKGSVTFQLHGFADASTVAYGACLYVRSENTRGEISTRLLISKTKVAPLKTITLPRLELCAAVVLSNLLSRVRESLDLEFTRIVLWSDSTVALSWIRTEPNLLQAFVSHRVAQIQSNTEISNWRHIPTADNPADLLSRGVSPTKLKESNLWWTGPQFLSKSEDHWPNSNFVPNDTILELKKSIHTYQVVEQMESFPIQSFSNLTKLLRVTASCIRFSKNCRDPTNKLTGSLTATEIDNALKCLVKISQGEYFSIEISEISDSKPLTGKLIGLNPFIDTEGILRVGGRIQASTDFPHDKKHPIILSSRHHLTKLVFLHEHARLFHAGPQLLLSSIRERFWPLGGRNLAKKVVHDCVKCARAKPNITRPIMGNLPVTRLTPMNVFNVVGVDYAGPFVIKTSLGRSNKTSKCYISLFICFTTKAIHLELVTSLSTDAFIAAFRRFASRRGKPQHVYSDNGKNFVGANSKLRQFLSENKNHLTDTFSMEGINWHFIPPHSPHFGGLWEAGVKSSKFHIKRVLSNALLTFEDFYTVLVQIEGILNSRPITPISSDPNDLESLTPSHFLIGKPIMSLPDQDVTDISLNRLCRYKRLQQIQQNLWKRWSKEFIAELQQRTKWKQSYNLLKVGSMVVIKDDNLPVMQWRLGRVLNIYPGADNIPRVAEVKTSAGVVKRAFSKICPLPICEQ